MVDEPLGRSRLRWISRKESYVRREIRRRADTGSATSPNICNDATEVKIALKPNTSHHYFCDNRIPRATSRLLHLHYGEDGRSHTVVFCCVSRCSAAYLRRAVGQRCPCRFCSLLTRYLDGSLARWLVGSRLVDSWLVGLLRISFSPEILDKERGLFRKKCHLAKFLHTPLFRHYK